MAFRLRSRSRWALRGGGRRSVLSTAWSDVGIRIGSEYGLTRGHWASASLRAWPSEEVESVIKKRSIPAHTDRTLTKPADLLAEIEQVRDRGWAVSEQELNENNAVAARCSVAADSPELAARARVRGAAERQADSDPGELLVDVAAASGSRRARGRGRPADERERELDSVAFNPPYPVPRVNLAVASRRKAVSDNRKSI